MNGNQAQEVYREAKSVMRRIQLSRLKQKIRHTWWDLKVNAAFWGTMLFFAAVVVAWVTHAFWTVTTLASSAGATGGQIVLGLLGIFVPPFGVIHGVAIWFGFGA